MIRENQTPLERAAERARINQMLADFKGRNTDETKQEREERQRAFLERSQLANERRIRAEYRARGLEPPPGALTSLSLLLSVGWSIHEIGANGSNVLVPPPLPKAIQQGESR